MNNYIENFIKQIEKTSEEKHVPILYNIDYEFCNIKLRIISYKCHVENLEFTGIDTTMVQQCISFDTIYNINLGYDFIVNHIYEKMINELHNVKKNN